MSAFDNDVPMPEYKYGWLDAIKIGQSKYIPHESTSSTYYKSAHRYAKRLQIRIRGANEAGGLRIWRFL